MVLAIDNGRLNPTFLETKQFMNNGVFPRLGWGFSLVALGPL